MTTDWNKHRFSGGALAFDMVNTVIYREDSARRQDRLRDAGDADQFAAAAVWHRRDELGDAVKFAPIAVSEFPRIIKMRESADAYFRSQTRSQTLAGPGLSTLLYDAAKCLDGAGSNSFSVSLALSVLGQLHERQRSRSRICPNCHWLFLDKSKNGSRIWCDMAVCGNRHKARLSYQRRKAGFEKEGD